jgi:hypothetical protein
MTSTPSRFRLFSPAVRAGRAVGQPHVAELGRQQDLVADALDRAADQLLVGAGRVGVGSVEEASPHLGGSRDGGGGRCRIGRAVDRRHAHAAEPDGRDCERLGLSEGAHLHGIWPLLVDP